MVCVTFISLPCGILFPFDEVAIDCLFSPSVNLLSFCTFFVVSGFCFSFRFLIQCVLACVRWGFFFSATHLELTQPCQSVDLGPLSSLGKSACSHDYVSFPFSVACWLSWLDLPVSYLFPLYFHLCVLLLWGLKYFFSAWSPRPHIWISRGTIFSSN